MAPPRRLLAAIALVALIGAGCANAPAETGGGGGEQPATAGGPSSEPDPNAAGGTSVGGGENAAAESSPITREDSLKFAECMRENGMEDFPDPDAAGIIQYYGEPDPAEFAAANEACRHLRPVLEGTTQGNGG
jgi:hypothetical protein